MKRRFLVVYDYGEGGNWAVVAATSSEAIKERFPELQIVDKRPGWMTDEIATRLDKHVIDVDKPAGLLADILAHRN